MAKRSNREKEARARPSPAAATARPFPVSTPDLLRAAGLFSLSLIAYLPALNGGMLWDDNGHITKPILRSLDGLRRIWLEIGATQQYYPLLHSAFWMEHLAWGDSTLGYHLINVILHTTCALLVVAIMRRLALPGAWLGGAIESVHITFSPRHSSSLHSSAKQLPRASLRHCW
jgi:protein O-mannosyl-transferase